MPERGAPSRGPRLVLLAELLITFKNATPIAALLTIPQLPAARPAAGVPPPVGYHSYEWYPTGGGTPAAGRAAGSWGIVKSAAIGVAFLKVINSSARSTSRGPRDGAPRSGTSSRDVSHLRSFFQEQGWGSSEGALRATFFFLSFSIIFIYLL